jgi:hypothetical protein
MSAQHVEIDSGKYGNKKTYFVFSFSKLIVYGEGIFNLKTPGT